uniref:Uncharacterized protein n=1 Tax=Ditylum brightwellii TaxID=49249 RepID=A0A6U3YRG6_9STRA|mmetsp:Transcript_31198/g.46520  ORF Transcript_31198/g.46520 Transcript_31198/m.46520 type:complete len:177 (+) Transcript_31198:69-599(+)
MAGNIPPRVQNVLQSLSSSDQVVLRSYIAGLRDEINRLNNSNGKDDDEHAHYHGHEKCTHDHGHSHDHGKEEKQRHIDDDKDETDHKHGHDHKHEHKHEHEHEHGHKKQEKDDVPEWKKKAMAMDNDPTAAPFGGSWNMESSMDATTGTTGKVAGTSPENNVDGSPFAKKSKTVDQ